jgi:hypothetical protein
MMWKATTFALMLTFPILAHAEPDQDCRIRLEFSSDEVGAVVNYVLTLQIKNTAGRNVRSVSVNYFDSGLNQLGNAEMICLGTAGDGITSGSHGECWTALQRVDSNLLKSFGTETWTAVVNSQLTQLDSIRKCEVLGFGY